MRKLLILLILPLLALVTMGAALSPAAAAPAIHATSVVAPTVVVTPTAIDDCHYSGCANFTPDNQDALYGASLYLPTNRWTNMNYHSRLNWWNPVEASNAATARGASGVMMNAGNMGWKVASDWSRTAMDFNPFNSSLGYQIDKVSGVIGNAITGQPVLFALIVAFLIAVLLWRALRRPGTRPFGKLIQSAIVFGLIMMMGTQAAAGTTASTPPLKYAPRAGSPVWIANAVTGTVDNMASTAVSGVMSGMLPILTNSAGGGAGSNPNGWSCAALIDGSFRAARAQTPTPGAEAVARAMNAMWLSTAYSTYTVVQFGDSNPYAQQAACRELERTTGADSYTKARMLSQSLYGDSYTVSSSSPQATTPFPSMSSPMLLSTSDNESNDAAIIAWAACQPNDPTGSSYTVRSGWGTTNGGWITPEDCKAAFTYPGQAQDFKGIAGGVFNIADIDTARTKTQNAAVLNFINTLQGRDMGVALGSTTASLVFLVGAVVAIGVFAVMSLAVFASKIFMLLLVAGMFLILVISLFKNDSMGETMQKPMYRFLGVTIFAFGSTLLLAILATFTLIIASLAGLFGAGGSVGAMLWISFSPLLAVIAVHFLFTKVFKMPSPMTPKGALAWGTAGGAVGGAVGAGLVNSLQNRAGGGAKQAGKKLLGSSKYTSWMVGGNGADARRGAGDAGSRKGTRDLGVDQTSAAIGDGTAGVGAGAAAELAMKEATRNMRARDRQSLEKEARRDWKRENPGAVASRVGKLRAKLEARQAAAAGLLADAVDAGDVAADESLLSAQARGKVGLTNRPSMDDFMLSPGAAAQLGSIPAAAWGDLSSAGRAQAAQLAARARRDASTAKKDERARSAQVRKQALAAARAELPPLSDRAKAAARGAVSTVSAAGTAAWNEARTRAVEFRADPAGASLRAAHATVDAARSASYGAKAGVDRARQVAASARSHKAAPAVAAGVGVGVAAMGLPVVGAVVVASVARKKLRDAGEARRERAETQRVAVHELMAARANARKLPAPGTSSVSDAAPKQGHRAE